MSSSNEKNFFAQNLLQLQNFIKRDPDSYKDEFLQTYHNYESMLQVYLMKPNKLNKKLADLALFLAHVAHCFKDELKLFPQQLTEILQKFATALNQDMRMTFCRCLMLLRTKNLIEPILLFKVFFTLIKCNDKNLRKTLYTQMLNDIKKTKTKLKNHKLCSEIQQFVFKLTKDQHPLVAKFAINLLIELYRKQIWNDAKTVNIIANGCLSKINKVLAISLNFFCGKDVEKDSDNESDSEAEDKSTEKEILLSLRVGKKSKKRQKRTERALKALRREKKSKKRNLGLQNLSALNYIYDPQDFAEKLFKNVEITNEGFELKLSMLDIIARSIGIHSLYINNFHTYLIRFLNPHQREVQKLLWFCAISSHDLTPPDTVEPVLMTISNNFITERNSSEVIAVGLNAVREISARCPLSMTEELLGDLVQYKAYKDKAVSSAAKSLIQLFREKNPTILNKRMRGKPTEELYEAFSYVKSYGQQEVNEYVAGAEVISLKNELQNVADSNNDLDKNEADEWEESSITDFDDDKDEDVISTKKTIKLKKRKYSEVNENDNYGEDDDDDDFGEWIDIENHDIETDDDDFAENANPNIITTKKLSKAIDEKAKMLTLEEKRNMASKISSEKIFSQEDFKKIRVEQLKKKLSDKNFSKKSKSIEIVTDSEEENNCLLPLSSITSINKKCKQDKEARIARIMEGRENRGKFGQKFKDNKLGLTNKEKIRNKSFQMVRHKINKKHKRSFKDKQIALRNSLLKQKRLK